MLTVVYASIWCEYSIVFATAWHGLCDYSNDKMLTRWILLESTGDTISGNKDSGQFRLNWKGCLFFEANEITRGKWVTWLLNLMGVKTFSLVYTLAALLNQRTDPSTRLWLLSKNILSRNALFLLKNFTFIAKNKRQKKLNWDGCDSLWLWWVLEQGIVWQTSLSAS